MRTTEGDPFPHVLEDGVVVDRIPVGGEQVDGAAHAAVSMRADGGHQVGEFSVLRVDEVGQEVHRDPLGLR